MAHRLVVCLAVLAVVVAGCNKSANNVQISDTRTVSAPAPAPSGESKPAAPPAMGGMMGGAKQVHAYTWTAPQGWETLPSTPMRMANFKVGADAECYLTVLSGTAGGAEMNINRWRAQMGQEEKTYKPEDLAALPKVSVAGKDGMLVEIPGSFTSKSGQPVPNSLMLVALADMGGETLFVKMVGPEASVAPQRDNLTAFCASLKQGEQNADQGDIMAPASGSACPMPGMGGGASGAAASGATCPVPHTGDAAAAPAAEGMTCPATPTTADQSAQASVPQAASAAPESAAAAPAPAAPAAENAPAK